MSSLNTGRELILISPGEMSASTPIAEKYPKPNITMNPKPMVSSGYVSAPSTFNPNPVPNISSGYVTHSILNVSLLVKF